MAMGDGDGDVVAPGKPLDGDKQIASLRRLARRLHLRATVLRLRRAAPTAIVKRVRTTPDDHRDGAQRWRWKCSDVTARRCGGAGYTMTEEGAKARAKLHNVECCRRQRLALHRAENKLKELERLIELDERTEVDNGETKQRHDDWLDERERGRGRRKR